MSDYIITVNSTVDTTREWLAERGVPYIPLKYTIDGQTYSDMEGLSSKEFFDKLREGKMSTTSQINPDEAREALEPYLKEGKDILHLSFSSGLSGTCNSMKIAAEELQEEYPERKIIVIDTLCACLGEALLLYYVLKQKENRDVNDKIDVTELLDHTRKERADRLFVLLIVFIGVYGVARFTQRGCIFFICVNVA